MPKAQRHTIIQISELQSKFADDDEERCYSSFPQGRIFSEFRWGWTIVLQLNGNRVRLSNSVQLIIVQRRYTQLTDRMASNVPLTYISGFFLNLRKKSANCGVVFFDNAMYETRFCGFAFEEGTSKAAMNGSVAYSERSCRINEGTPGDVISIS